MKLWTCLPEWEGHTAFIVCGGPSVASQNIELLRGRKVIAVNLSWEKVPFADFLYFTDSKWYYHNRPLIDRGFKGRIVSTTPSPCGPQVLYMQKVAPKTCGLTDIRNALVVEKTSAQAATNLAVHLGSKRVVLLGLDNQPDKDGKTHHHRPHPWKVNAGDWDLQRDDLSRIRKPAKRLGIEIINTSPVSRIDFWPKLTLEEALHLADSNLPHQESAALSAQALSCGP